MLSTFVNPTIVLSIPLTVPVKVGLAKFAFKAKELVISLEFAFKFKAVWVNVETGLLRSEVLSTFVNPIIVLSIPLTVPVKVGLAKGAFVPIKFVNVTDKFELLPSASEISFNVSNIEGAPPTKSLIFVSTYVIFAFNAKEVST